MHLCEEAMMCTVGEVRERPYAYFGMHADGDRFAFRVWIPDADAVSLCGDFNGWCLHSLPMHLTEGGVWEAFVSPDAMHEGDYYKYFVRRGAEEFFFSDPYAKATEGAPNDASVVSFPAPFVWRDDAFLAQRANNCTPTTAPRQPRNVYCLHPATWLRDAAGKPLDAASLARELSPYVKQMGYTHVALAAVAEADFGADGKPRSTALFAPSRTLGSPEAWRSFVNGMHEAGIGVLMDWSVEERTSQASTLVDTVTGGSLSSEDKKTAERELLSANLLYWAEAFHIDGFRLHGGDKVLLRILIEAVREAHPDVLLLFARAGGRSAPFPTGGMKETEITTEEPRERTDGNALSDRCAKARMTYLLRLTGYEEKETQMGEELGEETGERPSGEHADGVAWERLERFPVATLQRTVAELNHWYLSTPALWNNTDGAGHYRLLCEDGEKTAFCRRGRNGDEVTVLCNRGDTPLQNFLLPVCSDGDYREAVNTDASRFGGSGVTNGATLSAERKADGGGFGVRVSLAPHSALALVRDGSDRGASVFHGIPFSKTY